MSMRALRRFVAGFFVVAAIVFDTWDTARGQTFLELLGVHEADRSSGMIEDTHHLARRVMCDDWALCAATAQEIAEVADFIVESSGLKGLVKFHGASIDVTDGRMDRVPPLARN